jgi:hypothetical protein
MLVDVIDALSDERTLRWYFKIHNVMCMFINKYVYIYLFIHKHAHHIMNFEVLPESSLIKKYMYRPSDSTLIASTNITPTHDI